MSIQSGWTLTGLCLFLAMSLWQWKVWKFGRAITVSAYIGDAKYISLSCFGFFVFFKGTLTYRKALYK